MRKVGELVHSPRSTVHSRPPGLSKFISLRSGAFGRSKIGAHCKPAQGRGPWTVDEHMIQESFIHYKKNLLHYVKAGNGKQPLLVFHGFGQDHTLYVPLLKSLSKKYTLYIIDLFFHGKSQWNEDEEPLKKSEWNSILDVLFREQHITSFSILAYSLGGKFAMATIEAYPQQIKDLFLIAPDGIKTSFWYSLATYPRIFRSFFKSMILHHERFLLIARKLNHFNLVDKGLIRFADYQMNTEAKRKKVYYSWVVFRHLKFDLKKIADLINRHHIRLTMVIGKYDKVIKAENMNRLLKHVHHYRLEIPESGHSGLISKSLPFLTGQNEDDEIAPSG